MSDGSLQAVRAPAHPNIARLPVDPGHLSVVFPPARERLCTSSRWTCLRSMEGVASPRCVSRGCGLRSVITTSARLEGPPQFCRVQAAKDVELRAVEGSSPEIFVFMSLYECISTCVAPPAATLCCLHGQPPRRSGTGGGASRAMSRHSCISGCLRPPHGAHSFGVCRFSLARLDFFGSWIVVRSHR